MRSPENKAVERQRRYRRGHCGEGVAVLLLAAKGYRVIGRRVVPAGAPAERTLSSACWPFGTY